MASQPHINVSATSVAAPAAPPTAPSQHPMVAELSRKAARPLSLQTMAKTYEDGDVMAAAAYLHEELPVRLAKQVAEVRRALGGDAEGVAPYYEATLLDLLQTPKPDDAPSERAFGQKVEGLLAETKSAIPHALAQAVRARRAAAFASFVADGGGAVCANPARSAPDAPAEARKDFHLSRPERLARLALDRDLERFFTARVGIRLLAEHYLAVRDADAAPLISACRPADIAEAAAAEVSELARRAYGASPEVEVVGSTDAALTYVPKHMRYALGELLKNSARATVEAHRGRSLPPIRVVVADGDEDLAFKVCDEGGGFPRAARHDAWSWFWSSGPPLGRSAGSGTGGGLGLPMTRCLARYFGGELSLRPLEGHGTDAYLHLAKLGTGACENLPKAAEASPGNLDSSVPHHLYFDDSAAAASTRW